MPPRRKRKQPPAPAPVPATPPALIPALASLAPAPTSASGLATDPTPPEVVAPISSDAELATGDMSGLKKPALTHQSSDGGGTMNDDDEWGAANDDADGGDDGGDDGWGGSAAAEPTTKAAKNAKYDDLADQIPAHIRKRVIDDLDELAMTGRFVIGPIGTATAGGTPGSAAVEFPGGNRIHIRIGLPVKHLKLDPEQCRAWTLDSRKIIIVDLVFPPDYFDVSVKTAIKLKVGQGMDMKADLAQGFRLSWTIEKRITNSFLNGLPPLPDKKYDLSSVRDVMEVTGSTFYLAVKALAEKKGDVTNAVGLLNNETKKTALVRQLSHPEEADSKSAAASSSSSAAASKDWKEKVPTKLCSDLMKSMNISRELAEMALQLEPTAAAATALLTNEITRDQLEDIVKQKAADAAGGGDDGTAPANRSMIKLFATHNYLVRLMQLVEKTLATCNQTCMCCGDPLIYVGLKPTICSKDVCKYGFEDLGAGFDLSGEIAEQPQVVDLLITSAVAATAANRMHFVTPTNVKVTVDGKEYDFLTAATSGAAAGVTPELDLSKLKATLDKCPSIVEMQAMIGKNSLLEGLKKIDPLLAPLLRWIIGTNRAHIRQLLLTERMKSMLSEYQFVFLSSSPDKEARFQALKKAAEVKQGVGKGSILAWHGSDTGNWHSILRTGLKNMSNSKYMANGAAYGQGIYLAADSGTSLGYCRTSSGWAKSMFGPAVIVLSLCEIVNHPDLKPISSNHPYHVVPIDDWVATRYIFVFGKSERPSVVAEKLRAELPALKTGIEVADKQRAKEEDERKKKEEDARREKDAKAKK